LGNLTVPYLESLSTGELNLLAEKHGLDIPPDIDRFFIIEELFYLDYNAEDTEHHDINFPESNNVVFKEFDILPKQYHITYIEVLIRDPLWAFTFWEVKESAKDIFKRSMENEGYCLRVIPLREDGSPDMAGSFIVAVDMNDCGRYLGFPPDNGRRFKVELCMQIEDHIKVIAESRPFTLPGLIDPKMSNESIRAVYGNSLAQMSGIDSFSLVRSEDRLLRSRDNQR